MPNFFSIAMCTYNGARQLREQLDSIAAQSRLPDELVVCDDGSTDATRAILADFAASSRFPVHLHFNEQNLGSTKNFERATGHCVGNLIALCDQDDVWLTGKLLELEAEFDHAPTLGLIFTDAEIIDETGHSTGQTLWEKLNISPAERRQLRSRKAIDVLLQGSTVTGATLAFRGSFKKLVLPIPDNLPIIHDAWISMLVGAVSEVLPLAKPLSKYRQHPQQQIGPKARLKAGGGVLDSIQRKTAYNEMIQIGTEVHRRLSEHRDSYESAAALSRLEERLTHLRARARLPEGKVSRARSVAGELLSRRYHRYSNGFRSAVKDLLA